MWSGLEGLRLRLRPLLLWLLHDDDDMQVFQCAASKGRMIAG